jgi:acyl-CoA synthetase (AMP-forming)/AMP-acid ligase II
MTESGPFGLFVTSPNVKAGDLGVPTPGMELKLVDTDGKTEVRYRGPNITQGYWRAPEETADAFDEEGFFCTGDAVKWIDETDVHQGLANLTAALPKTSSWLPAPSSVWAPCAARSLRRVRPTSRTWC